MTKKVLLLPGDGIGPEVVAEAAKVIESVSSRFAFDVELDTALIGGCAYEATGSPLPDETLAGADDADALLLGAVGGMGQSGPGPAAGKGPAGHPQAPCLPTCVRPSSTRSSPGPRP